MDRGDLWDVMISLFFFQFWKSFTCSIISSMVKLWRFFSFCPSQSCSFLYSCLVLVFTKACYLQSLNTPCYSILKKEGSFGFVLFRSSGRVSMSRQLSSHLPTDLAFELETSLTKLFPADLGRVATDLGANQQALSASRILFNSDYACGTCIQLYIHIIHTNNTNIYIVW